jgi:glycerol-3-phosphate acyltransferase PlsY
MLSEIILIGSSYLFGSLPLTAALAKMSGLDLSQERDLHTALWHKASKSRAVAAGFVDFLKPIIPMLIGFGLGLSTRAVAFCGVAATAGQMWPPFPGCHGEKGNTSGVGVIITLSVVSETELALLSLIPFAVGATGYAYHKKNAISNETINKETQPAKSTHFMALSLPLGMLIGFIVAPISSWYSKGLTGTTQGFLALLVIIVLRRLTADLKADLKKGNGTTKILINRLLFDQSLIQ